MPDPVPENSHDIIGFRLVYILIKEGDDYDFFLFVPCSIGHLLYFRNYSYLAF